MKNLYAAFLCIFSLLCANTQSQAKSFSSITGNTIGSDQTICNGSTPSPLTGSVPGGGTGIYAYQWQVSSTSAIAGFANIAPNGTNQGYIPGALAANRWYRRIVISGIEFDTTAAVTITVTPIITAASNTITANQTICFNTIPATLNGPAATGGNGTYTYQWQSSPDNLTFSNIPGANAITLIPSPQTSTTWFRRIVTSGGCTNSSASVKITVTPIITTGSNTISIDQSICNGQTPIPLTGSTPTGATGAYAYLWESSTTSAAVGFSTAAGTSNGKNYSPLALTQSTWFHRIVNSGGCADTSAAVMITVVNTAPGNPAVFGNGVWNVYGYSDNAFATYAGYYTEPLLSFNTTTRYTNAQSPSYASGYQGCLIPTTNFSVSMKQTNFTPGSYQINLNLLDDNLNVILNGTPIYAHTCCVAAPINNVWTGNLGASDQMELRWTQATGPSYLSVQFLPVTPAPLIPGGINQNMQVCYGEVPPAGFTSTGAPTSGCTLTGMQWQRSIDSVTWVNIPGATAITYTETAALTQTTWYRRMATDACNNAIATVPVKVTVNVVAPGDPTVYGNNTWNVYVYQGTGAFNIATYKGYYTEPLLSFDSRNRWASTASPSSASGYQGCVVNPLNTWISYKRTNFTPAIYQIDIPYHDDFAYLFINGILVFSHLGCCDSHTNVWTGPLGPTDQVEYRISQGGGPSYEMLTLTPVTPPALTSGAIVPNQTICAGDVPPTPLTESVAPTGGCTIKNYTWEYSTDNGTTWTAISGATAISYTITNSIYVQTLYRRTVNDVCGNSAISVPITISMNNSAPGNPAVFGNNTWNVYCFQDINYSIYAGYYTEPLLTFQTTNRYPSTSPPSTASGYQGCQLINTYYSVSMKRTGFTAGLYQIDVTSDDDYNLIYINGALVSSLTYPTIQNNVWTGNLGPTDQIEVRWRNNAGPGQTGVRFTLVTPTPLTPGSIVAYNPTLCFNDLPIINEVTPASGGCFVNYSWQSSIDGGITWTTIAGATGNTFTATVAPTTNIQYRRVATDVCGNVANSAPVSFTQTAGTVGNPSVYGNGAWNVYAYDAEGAAFSAAQYLGYYVEPLLSFNSLNRWGTNAAPSDASGYQGCQVDQDNHWVSYRRTNFTPGTYQLDVTYHDDDAYLFINGVQVWSQTGCCQPTVTAWIGTLGATDQVEFRWREFFGGSSGAMNLTLVTPVTTVNPGTIAAGQTICANTSPVAFTSSLDATSTCFISYQWQSSPDNTTWTDISGATANIYSPGPIAAKTYFRRNAINACGVSAFSNIIIVDVYPVVLTGGSVTSDQTICKGATPAAFTSTGLPTGGDGNYVYQWQSSLDNIGWSNIAGATAATYAPGVTSVTTYFRRKVTACGAASVAYSNFITINVNTLPTITMQPANPTSCTGGSTSVSVSATGTGISYQWQVNTGSGFVNVTNVSPYSGATTATLLINPVTAGMAGYKYQVIITGTCTPPVTSNQVTLTVATNPVITTQPANTTVCAGTNATFSINASGSGITYQWQIKVGAAFNPLTDGASYSGTATPVLTVIGATAGMSGNIYRCALTTTCAGVLNSNTPTLTVVAPPANTISADQTICTGINASNLTGSTGLSSYLWQSSTVTPTTGFVNASGTNNTSGYTVPNPVTSTTYYQRIGGNGTCTDTSNIVTITLNNTTISITSQPAAQAVCIGGTATFTATATGPGALTYQWFENGVGLTDGGIYTGTSTNTLTLTGVTAGMNNNSYVLRVFASGCSAGFKATNAAILTDNNGPVITQNAANFTTCQGSGLTITIKAAGLGLTYQWQVNTGTGWNNLSNLGSYSNVNGNILQINPSLASMNGYQYQCVVTGTCAPFTATTSPVTMFVNSPVANNSISNSQTLCAGTPAPFSGSTPTEGTGTYTYQWFLNTGSGWFAISGATGINYSSGPLTQTTQFLRQVTSGACAAVNSTAITVTILPPTSTLDPSNTTVCAGTTATFSVTAAGSSLSYQWQVNTGSGWSNVINGASYTGVTTATLSVLTPPFSFNGYQYRCVVNGGCVPLSVTSNPATLTVSPVAIITSQPSNVNTCAGSNASYQVTATGTGLSYQWMEKTSSGVFTNITDGGIYSGSLTPTLTLSGVSVAMNNNQYMCVITTGTCPVNSLIASLTVSAQPSLIITNPATICAPATVDLTAPAVTAGSNLAGGILTYWNNITFTSPVANPTAVPLSGTYYIRVATSAVCYDIKPVVVTISASITNNNISSSQSICTGSTPAALTGGAPGGGTSVYTYQWQQSTDNITYSNIAGATNPGYSPGALGVTTWFRRMVNSGTCSNTSPPVQITVVAYPTATISYASSPFCASGIASVTQTGQTGGVYSAPAPVSINASTGAINLSASTPGSYTITYNFSNGTCNGSTTTSVVISALPTATISYSGSPYCATGTANVTLTGQAGGTYTAPAGLSIDPTTGAVNLASSTLGTYTVTYSFSNGTCNNSTTTLITINALPAAAIAYNGSPYCALGTAIPSQSGQAGGTYTAPAGVVINAVTGAVNLATSTPGTYTVTYSFTGGGCSNTTTASITINALPTATIAYSGSPYCATGTATVTQTGQAGGTYTAPAGVSITAATGAINLITSTAGTYTVTYSFSNGTCSNTTTTSITINPLPTATIAYTGSPYCATGTATVTQTGQTGGTYTAPAGVSITAATGDINLAASTPGTYTITYSYGNGTCNNTATASITINALPAATIAYTGSPYCASFTANVTRTGQAGGTYTAPAGVVINAATGAINLAGSTPGTFIVTYTFSNGICSNTATASITINALPVAAIAYTATPYCKTGTATVTQTGQAGGTYTAPAGVSITAATGAINLATSTAGTYTITYSFTNGTCNQTTTAGITINALPVATIAYAGSPYCATGTATVTQTGQAGGTYTAPAGVVINSATGAIDLVASTPGTYTVTYSFTNGTCSNTATSGITIKALPAATIAYAGSPYCATGTATVTQTGQAGGTYTAPAGVSITAATGAINLVTSTPGTYTITYSFTSGGCSNTTTTSITINALPTATIAYSGSPYCATGTASVTQTGQAGGIYTAPAGVSINAATGDINLGTSTPGTYTVTYSFGNGTCNNTTTASITIKALPAATIAYAGSPYCATGTATVTQTGQAGGTYTAPAGVSITAATGAINLVTSTPGTYIVTYSFTSGGCSNTTTASITINALPVATIAYTATPYCKTGTATVTQTGQTGGTYSAPAGVFITPATGDINLAASTAGTYTITYSFSNGTCNNTTTTSITINALPTATISYAGSPYCATGTATVTQSGQAGGTYTAPAGLSITGATGAINLATSTPGTYTVTYSFGNGTCNSTTTTSVTVKALPTATIVYSGSPYCATGTATVTQTGQAGGTYSAPAGVSITAATGAINLVTSTPGTYTVTYSFTSGGCSNTTTASITINALPTATIAYGGSPYCATGTATVTQTGQAGGTYTAPAGVSITAATGDINLATSTPGTYTVTYSFGNGTCNNTTTTSVTIKALPTATIVYSGSPYCATGTATVTQTGQAGGTYTAPAGVSIIAATGAINLAASTPGTYTVTYSFASGGCSNTTTASITINALPTATIAYGGSPYCATGTATVTQTGQAGGIYTAPAGVSITAATGAINLATSTAGTYTVTYSFGNGTCNNTTTTSITINALPTATIAYSGSPYCATGTATVTQTGQAGGTYTAPAGVSITAASGAINLATSTAGTYTVTYSFGNGTCNNTATASITIKALPVATIAYAGSPYCATGTATVTQTGQGGGTYSAPAGVSITAATGAINLATSTPGTYTVTYSFTGGGCSNTTTTSITINALPTATVAYTGSPYCATGTATVTQTGQAGGTYTAPAGVSITAATGAINLATSTPGTYTITYSFGNGTCNNTTTTSITINALPSATIAYTGSPYCASFTANVTRTGQAGGTYSAPAGIIINAATGVINLAASTPGTYTITYSFSNGTCSNTTTASITINALPTATITYAGSPYCATGTATVTQAGQTGGTYSAPAGVSITAATGAINLATSTPGTYTITYSFTNGTCNQTTTASITINALPTATISYAGSPYCATGTATVTQTGQVGGTYSAPAGVSIAAATGAINLTTSTPGTYTITYSFGNGTCSNTTTASITINSLPTATIAYAGSPYCATGTATVTQTGQAGGTYSAPAGVSIAAATGAINLTTSTPGTYTVTYSFSNGTCNNTTTASITINALPTATISYAGSPYCATGTATVTQTGQAGGTYSAPAGVSITAATGAINLVTSTPGTYTVTYSFGNGTCNNTTTASITINALPTATIAYSGSPYCATGTATVTQTGQAGGTYSAPAGVSITAATGAINLVTSTPGIYTITYSFGNGTCNNTTTASITINALPTATISYSGSPYCATGTATVTQTGQAGGTYTAPAGVSITAATGAINLAASTPGTYTVTYSFGNGTCNNTTTASITINALPTATIAYSGSPYCATGTATVTQTGQAGGTYSAPAGVSITAATGAINLATSTSGTYTVTYSFSNGTCNHTTTASITINALPTATIAYGGSPYCATGTATVTQTGQAGGTYSAPAGISITAATGAINLATSTPGTYTITYSFSNGICNNTTTASITINALPTATISYAGSPYCATGTATVTQTGQAGGTYTAPAGVSITAATGAINLTTSTPGTYTITYSFGNGTCNNTTTASITINALPTATIAYSGSPYCATGTATITQTGQAGGAYTAPAGVVINAATGAINLATSTPGTYSITYSFTNGTCNNTVVATITIVLTPQVIITNPPPVCTPSTVDLTAASVTAGSTPGLTYTYFTDAAATLVLSNANAVSISGTYYIKGSAGSGCSDVQPVVVTVNTKPTVVITNPASVCAPGTVDLTVASVTSGSTPGLTFTYFTDPAATTTLTNPNAVATGGIYYIKGTNASGCSDIKPVTVTINALPAATISFAGSPYCATGTATVTQTGQAGGTYTAPAGVSITAATGAINLATSTPGTYTITYSFSNGTCNNTTTASITINALPIATISYAGSPYCATGTASVTQTGQAGGTYSAPAGVSITAATGAINLALSTPGTYTVTYSFSNGTCNNTTTASITINSLPTATISYPGSPYCATGTATVTQTGQAGGTYTAPGGVSITAATGAINLGLSAPGIYTVTYSFSNGTCNNTATASITINALPTATISYPGSPYCATGTATVTQTGQAGGTYSAPAGVSITAATGAINLATSTPGTYTITYSFGNGTCNNTTTASITINALPTATISYAGSPYCATGTATVTQTGQAGGTYSAPAGVSMTAATGAINLATSTPGTYTVTYSFSNGTCNNTTTTSITINALPTATIAYTGSPYCASFTANVTQTGQTGGTYTAPAGIIINAATGDINLAASTPGTYTITYSFSNGTCSNTATASITINALPNATITYAGSPYCATGTATVTQTGQAGGTYTAPAGVSITAATGAINLSTSTPGTYTVTYSFTNGICNQTTTANITINALPTATIAYSGSPYCGTGIATVTQTGQAGGTYSAPAGVSITVATGAINLTTSTPGTYTVTYSFSNGTCSNTTTTSITINSLPTATISYVGSPYCATGTASVTQTGQAGGTYSAPAGVVINAATGAVNLATSTPGIYTITYAYGNGTCSNTTTASITINALPTATIVYSGSPYCASFTANVTRTGQAGGTYSAPAGVVINAATGAISLSASTPGTYTITYSFSNGTCSNSTTASITINALPTATITYAGSPYCATGTATVTQTGQAGGTYTAPAGVSITAATGAINLATSTPGTYTITYSFTNGTCNQTTTAGITINALPTATISYAGSPYCATGTATVTQTGQAGGNYAAPAGVSITAATGDINLTTSTPGTYTITYSFGNGTCSNTTSASITINSLPTATITYAGSPYCATGTATVNQTGQAGGIYSAPAGVSITPGTGAINLTTSTPGTYTVTYSFGNGTCNNTTTTSITINALPTASIAYAGSPYCATGIATVTQTGQAGGTYTAPAGVVINAVTGDINVATSTPGTYTITYAFGNGTCSNTTTSSITINALPTATIAYTGSPYCASFTANVTQTGQAGGTYTAPAAVSINAATGDINLAASTPGTYTITYSFSNGTCSNTTTASITINALPTATITYAGSPYCATGTATVTQIGQAGGTYSAPAGVSITAATGAINLATSTPGTYTITYTFTNGTCNQTTTAAITINALPTATITYAGSPYCATGTATITQTGQAGGTYTAPAGIVINPVTGDIDLLTSTVGTYTVTYSFSNGTCSNTTTTSVTINALPTATIAYSGSPYCATGTATVTQTGQPGGTYTAPAAVSINAITGDINLATSTAGTYTVTYSFSNGTCSNTTTASVTINALPTATIAYAASPYCATGTAAVTQAGQSGGNYTAPAGVVIDGTTGDINLSASTTGTYTVTYSFGNGTCNNTTTTTITINALPTASVSYSGSPYCATGTASVTQTGQAGGTFSSTAGLVINASTGDIDLVASTAGTYTVTYTFSNGTCGNTTTASLTITTLPVLIITNPAPVCAPATVDITTPATTSGSAAGLTYLYYQDAAGTTILPNPTAITLGGTYYIKGTAASGCSNIQPVLVTINPKPVVVTNDPAPVCAPNTIDLTLIGVTAGSTPGLVYTYFQDAAASIVLTNPNAVAVGGTYYLKGTSASGCSDIKSVLVTINALPTATIVYSGTPYCATGTATVTQTGQAGGVYNAPAAVSINNATGDINLAASTPGTYTVTYTFSNGTCSNSTAASISINPMPNVVTNNPAAVCAPLTVNLTNASVTAGSTPGLTFTYFKDAAGTIVLANASTVSVSGTYYIKGTSGSGCSDIKSVVVTINPLPVATISYNGSPYCTNGTAFVTLTGTGGGTFASSPGLSLNNTTGDIDLTTSAEGTYNVVYSFTNGTCSNSVFTSVTIKNPALIVNNPAGTCFPATIDLTNPAVTAGTQPGLSFNYYQDNAGTIPLLNPATAGAGTYYLKGVDMATGCASDIQPVIVTVFTKPTVTASASETDICKGTMITLTAVSPGNTINWPGVGTGNSVSVTPLIDTTYMAVATTTNGCMDTASVSITVKPFLLTLTANPDPVLAGTNTTFTTSGNFTYNVLSWAPNILFADQTATSQNIVVNDTTKSFTVIAQSTDGCLDTATLNIVVDPNLKDFFIPNSFSPNNDGNNDIFKVYGSSVRDVTMRVYNQWGELIFESRNATSGWDGTWKGRPQAVGVYIYVAQVTFYNNVSIKRKGTINLIR